MEEKNASQPSLPKPPSYHLSSSPRPSVYRRIFNRSVSEPSSNQSSSQKSTRKLWPSLSVPPSCRFISTIFPSDSSLILESEKKSQPTASYLKPPASILSTPVADGSDSNLQHEIYPTSVSSEPEKGDESLRINVLEDTGTDTESNKDAEGDFGGGEWVTKALTALCFILYLTMAIVNSMKDESTSFWSSFFGGPSDETRELMGALVSINVLQQHQYYTLATAIFLNGSLFSFITTMGSLFVSRKKYHKILGSGGTMLTFISSGLMTNMYCAIFVAEGVYTGAAAASLGLQGSVFTYHLINFKKSKKLKDLGWPLANLAFQAVFAYFSINMHLAAVLVGFLWGVMISVPAFFKNIGLRILFAILIFIVVIYQIVYIYMEADLYTNGPLSQLDQTAAGNATYPVG